MIIVIGEILIDIFQDYQRIGGAPFNFAFHLKQLGFPVRFFTRVGNDHHGRRTIHMLKKNGFSEADIQIDSRRPTGTVHADLLKVNETELADIQLRFDSPAAAADVMPWLMETFKINAVALTRGSCGSSFYSHDMQINIPSVAGIPIVDTVGAGDGYAAVLAAGCMQQIPWEETIRQASRFAARICGIAGAVPDDDNFYDDFRLLRKGDPNGR